MKLDLSQFKKVKSDKQSTTLLHPKGHTIKVAHASLSPKMRGELASLPMHMAEGGEAEDQSASGAELQNQQGQPNPQAPVVVNVNSGQPQQQAQPPTPQQPPQEQNPPQQPQSKEATPDELAMRRKRDLYNIRAAVNNPNSEMDPINNLQFMFGPNGEKPESFDARSWQQAESAYKDEQERKLQNNQEQIARVTQENAVRQQAGLPPLPVPPSLQPNSPPPPPGVPDQAQAQAAQQGGAGQGDMFGNEAYYGEYSKGLREQKAGIMGEARAAEMLAAAQSKILQGQVENQRKLENNYQTQIAELDKERAAFQDDIKNSHIDPNRFLNSMGTGQKIRTAIGLILGGMGGGLTKQGNPALQMLQRQIDADIASQRDEISKKQNLLSANLRQYGNLRDATDVTRVMQMDIVSNQLKEAAAKASDPQAKARALQAAGQLDMQAAPIMSQIAMRRSLLGGMQQGQVDPGTVIRMIVPQGQQAAAYKELGEAQNMVRARDNMLGAFDKIAQMNTVGNRVTSPIQSARQIAALRDPLVAALSKETAGRFTEQDSKMLETLFPAAGDTDKTLQTKRARMEQMLSEKMHFPMLQSYGINPSQASRYGSGGEKKIQMGAPIAMKK